MMKKIIITFAFIVISPLFCSRFHAQEIKLHFPHFAGQSYDWIVFQSETPFTVRSGVIDPEGRVTLVMPEAHKTYRGMTRWMLKTGGGLDMIYAGKGFSVECLSEQPGDENIIYKGNLENDFLSAQYKHQQILLEKLGAVNHFLQVYTPAEDHIYAVMLLGHFKKQSVHKLIIDLFSLPDNLPHHLFGDICTENLPTILFNTCGGVTDHIKSMILNKDADDFCRISACQALSYAVIEGYTPRKVVIEFFGTLFTGDETDKISDFWGLLASIACDLYPKDIIKVVQDAFESGLIIPGVIGYEHFERALDLGEEYCLEKIKTDFKYQNLDDLHKSMSWWACFDQGERHKNFPDYNLIQTDKSQEQKTKAKKNTRKQAKKSRKKNRR